MTADAAVVEGLRAAVLADLSARQAEPRLVGGLPFRRRTSRPWDAS